MDAFVTSLGWTGAVICIVAYLLVSRGTWSPSSTRYQLANIAGALLLCTVAARGRVWPSVATNLVWAAIGAQAIVTLVRARRARNAAVPVTSAPITPASSAPVVSGTGIPAVAVPTQAVRADLSPV